MEKGKIKVTAENIFPIIKKFLYSYNDIFLRELISNAVDACVKIKTLANLGKLNIKVNKLEIEVKVDKANKILIIADNGIGMTIAEVKKYINQIAFSSAEEFLKKYKTEDAIIGNFGLGFYSSFLVSDKVEILTKSYQQGIHSVHWICDGTPNFILRDAKKEKIGTVILLHLNEKYKEFLEDYKILELLKKYCRFLPIPIKFKNKIINNTHPLWKKKSLEINDKEYRDFYKELFPEILEDPLLWIHLNIEHPFKLTGILYFSKLTNPMDLKKDKIHLYQNQVFVTEHLEGIVPDFLSFLKGVIDSPDIPLNVSRSHIKSNITLKKISNYITRKIADRLTKMFLKDRKSFEKNWKNIKLIIEYGMISEPIFYEKAKAFALYSDINGKYFLFSEFLEKIKKKQKSKANKIICFYATNLDEQNLYIENVLQKGYKVLLLDTHLTVHLIQKLETDINNLSFVRVDSQNIENIFMEKKGTNLTQQEKNTLKKEIGKTIDNKKFKIKFENLNENYLPFIINIPEFIRRINEINLMRNFKEKNYYNYNLVVNTNNKIIKRILRENKQEIKTTLIRDSLEFILLCHNLLKGKNKNSLIKRILENICTCYKI
ncbi:molecular chaperone HtpG [Candidatus Karelsulcia muelleri]|uniref:molecular chaperone HtpG n=1 Tax=Candidatus Karelsulcia muelleri TaxID=336810 RepID=UPI00194EA172|nr:molecular chaperone HtpG [Candidatus Karelsulcia muelleri]